MRNLHVWIIVTAFPVLHSSASQAKNLKPQTNAAGVCLTIDQFNQAGGSPPIVIGFDDLPCDSHLDRQAQCGVTFQMVNAPLTVVCAADTFTPRGFQSATNVEQCALRATSGEMLLSPGGSMLGPGPNPAVEDDDIVMIFDPPVACVAFDHISQYADGMSYTQVSVIADDGSVLHRGTLDIGSGRSLVEHGEQRMIGRVEPTQQDGPEHTVDFWGFVSSARNIREVRIDETDDNDVCPDSNIGIDSVRFAPVPLACGSADVTGDGRIDSADVHWLVGQFGPVNPMKDGIVEWSAADLNRDGLVDEADLVELLFHVRERGHRVIGLSASPASSRLPRVRPACA